MPDRPSPGAVALARAMRATWAGSGRDLWDRLPPDERAAWTAEAAKIERRLMELGCRIIER